MITSEKFYNLYNKNSPLNKDRHIGPIDSRLFLRDMSLPIAYFLAKKHVSAFKLTITFLVIAVIANLLFIIPSFLTLVSLVVLLELAQLLDCVDGQLARYYGCVSKRGENLDTLAHVLTSCTFMLAFGIRLWEKTGVVLFVYLGLIGAIAKIFDHFQIINHATILDSSFARKIVNNSRVFRYILYLFQSLVSEIRIFAGLLLLFTIIEYFNPTFHLIEVSFVIFFIASFIENFFYLSNLLSKQLFNKKYLEI